MNEFCKLLFYSGEISIAFWSLLISMGALITTVIFNLITHKQYIDSLQPLLSFKLYKEQDFLMLSISNKGRSEANDIKIRIKELTDNGSTNQLCSDDIFKNCFELYPEENIQVIVATCINALGENLFPKLKISVEYINGNNKRQVKYCRVVTNSRVFENENSLREVENHLESISLSNNRLANYMEGRFLTSFDRLHVAPKSSLFEDLKNAIQPNQKDDGISEEKENNNQHME